MTVRRLQHLLDTRLLGTDDGISRTGNFKFWTD